MVPIEPTWPSRGTQLWHTPVAQQCTVTTQLLGPWLPDWLHNQCSVSHFRFIWWICSVIHEIVRISLWNKIPWRASEEHCYRKLVDRCVVLSKLGQAFLGGLWNWLMACEKWSVWNWAGSTGTVVSHKPIWAAPPAPFATQPWWYNRHNKTAGLSDEQGWTLLFFKN